MRQPSPRLHHSVLIVSLVSLPPTRTLSDLDQVPVSEQVVPRTRTLVLNTLQSVISGPAATATDDQVNHGDSYGSRGSGFDKTGNLDQEAHKYESTGAGGPTTTGAANTDKFDTDRSGATGNSYGATDSYPDLDHTESRKGTGGVAGIVSILVHRVVSHTDVKLGTKDSEFTANPSRTGKGAYTDDDAHFKTNTDGPSGHSALTGREGTTEHNPVAQAKTGEHGTGAHDHEKKGLVEKVKEVFHK